MLTVWILCLLWFTGCRFHLWFKLWYPIVDDLNLRCNRSVSCERQLVWGNFDVTLFRAHLWFVFQRTDVRPFCSRNRNLSTCSRWLWHAHKHKLVGGMCLNATRPTCLEYSAIKRGKLRRAAPCWRVFLWWIRAFCSNGCYHSTVPSRTVAARFELNWRSSCAVVKRGMSKHPFKPMVWRMHECCRLFLRRKWESFSWSAATKHYENRQLRGLEQGKRRPPAMSPAAVRSTCGWPVYESARRIRRAYVLHSRESSVEGK